MAARALRRNTEYAPQCALLAEAVRSMDEMLSSWIDINRLEKGAIQPVIRDFPLEGGIRTEHLAWLFDAFYCRLLDHAVTIESKLGQGSTFTVRLPRGISTYLPSEHASIPILISPPKGASPAPWRCCCSSKGIRSSAPRHATKHFNT